MATIKSYTNIEQSKKLAEILPLESADMYYFVADSVEKQETNYAIRCGTPIVKTDIPCWSLASLLELMPDGVQTYKTYNYVRIDITFVHNGIVTGSKRVEDKTYINAAFEMVCWLIEQEHIKISK